MENIVHGYCQEANIARGKAKCLYWPQDHACMQCFPVVHERKQYFNWFIVMYTDRYFLYHIFQGKL